jgi:hypothetical protein
MLIAWFDGAPVHQGGSMPFFLFTGAVAGEARNWASAFAVAGSLAPEWMPAENTVNS